MPNLTVLGWMFLAWSVVTVSLVLMLIYRSVVGMKEEDQLFLDPVAESHFEKDQHQILARLDQINRYAKGLGFASGGLLVAMIGFVVYLVSS